MPEHDPFDDIFGTDKEAITDVELRDIGNGLVAAYDQNGNFIEIRGDSTPKQPLSGIGLQLFDGSGNLIGTLVETPGQAIRSFGPLAIQTPSGGLVRFQSGFYLSGTAANPLQLQLDAQGNILNQTNATLDSGGSSGPGRTQFPSEVALQEAQANLANANAALAQLEAQGAVPISPFQKQQLELDKLIAENNLKALLVGEIGAERRTLIGEQGATKRKLLDLGPDPFKQAANLSGQVTRGVTPQQAAVGRAQQFINQPLPTLDFNATLPQLQAQIGTLQGIQAPQLTGGFGLPSLAHGGVVGPSGVINMERGSDGAFSRVPAIVGEAGPELALLPPGAEIIPLSKLKGMDLSGIPRAQEGLEVSPSSLLQALSPLFSGFQNIPTRTGFGQTGETITGGFGQLSQLGVQPEFVRDVQTGQIFRIQGGTRQWIPAYAAAEVLAGVSPSDVIGATTAEIQRLAPQEGPFLTSAVPPDTGFQPAFQGSGTPWIEPTTGAILPAPFKIAGDLGRFSRERPDLFSNALSAYSAAGLSPESVLAQIEAATPTGRFNTPQRLGFTGRTL